MLLEELAANGHVFREAFEPSWSTIQVAQCIGPVLSFANVPGYEKVSEVQTLRPRVALAAKANVYSGAYGFSEFPLHTDLAHWYRPPRYFILRCLSGASEVATTILDGRNALLQLGRSYFSRALFLPRRAHNGRRPLLRALHCFDGVDAMRWDSLFLCPANDAARSLLKDFYATHLVEQAEHRHLRAPGDTLLIDNWRCMHGRSPVPATGCDRLLQRSYLEGIHL